MKYSDASSSSGFYDRPDACIKIGSLDGSEAVGHFSKDSASPEVIVVGAESSFAEAWDLMAEVIGLGWDKLEDQEGEALTAANEMLPRHPSRRRIVGWPIGLTWNRGFLPRPGFNVHEGQSDGMNGRNSR